MTGVRSWRAVVLAMLSLAAAPAAHAAVIQLDITTTVTDDAQRTVLTLVVRNRGTDPAYDVAPTIEVEGRIDALPAQPQLMPGGSFTWDRTLTGVRGAGTWPGVVRLGYRDAGDARHEAVHVAFIQAGPPRRPPEPLTLRVVDARGATGLELAGAARIGRDLRVRIVAPASLLVTPATTELAAGATPDPVRADVRNLSARPGSRLNVVAIVEWDDADGHGATFAAVEFPIASATAAGSPTAFAAWARPTGALTALMAGFLVLCWALVAVPQLIARRPPSPTSPAVSTVVSVLAVAGPTCVLLSLLPADAMFADTTATGGDMGSHTYAAEVSRQFLRSWRLTGWVPGNYAGFPLFQMYFPVPFVAIAAAATVISANVAFKLVSVSGLLALPVVAFWLLRRLGVPAPGPQLAPVAVLCFLLQDGNAMWGGNVPSTLAGEFAYSISLAIALAVIGLATGPATVRRLAWQAATGAVLTMTHAYTVLWVAATLLLSAAAAPAPAAAALRASLALGWAGALSAFWLVPLVVYAPWTTAFKHVWIIQSFDEVVPPPLWPVAAVAVVAPLALRASGASAWRSHLAEARPLYAAVGAAVLAYGAGSSFGIVDVRFLPFAQLGVCLMAAAGLGRLLSRVPAHGWSVAIAGVCVLSLVGPALDRGTAWARWNYEGFERKAAWPVYAGLADRLRGDAADPRVAYEHAGEHEVFGTVRAFENLPLFSGRSTLEGVNLQASVTSPFVFFIQSEISQVMSCPFPEWGCSRPDFARGVEHLRMMNVSQVIVRSDQMRAAAGRTAGVTHGGGIGAYDIFAIEGSPGYVSRLAARPVAVVTTDWKVAAYQWFKTARPDDPVPVWVARSADVAGQPFAVGEPSAAPAAVAPRSSSGALQVSMTSERIVVTGARPGEPLLVRVSYHPRWQSTSGERVWLAGPGFMLVVPDGDRLELTFGESPWTMGGVVLSAIALAALVYAFWHGAASWRTSWAESPGLALAVRAAGAAAVVALSGVALFGRTVNADAVYRNGQRLLDAGDLAGARTEFDRARQLEPLSNTAIHSTYFAAITWFRQERWTEASETFGALVREFPEAHAAAEAHYHLGLCAERLGRGDEAAVHYGVVAERFSDTIWARLSAERVQSLVNGHHGT